MCATEAALHDAKQLKSLLQLCHATGNCAPAPCAQSTLQPRHQRMAKRNDPTYISDRPPHLHPRPVLHHFFVHAVDGFELLSLLRLCVGLNSKVAITGAIIKCKYGACMRLMASSVSACCACGWGPSAFSCSAQRAMLCAFA